MAQTGLNMSRRIRRTPYTGRAEAHGIRDYSVVNHMLLPKAYAASVEEDYWHLREHVQVWDVGCQRQVQVTGPDAAELVQLMTPRDLRRIPDGQGLYIPLIDEHAGMINDPVLLKLEDDKFWLSIADSDVLLFAKGIAFGRGLDVLVEEPDVFPLAVQGPKAETLMTELFGDEIAAAISSPNNSVIKVSAFGPCTASGNTSGSSTKTSSPLPNAIPLANSNTSESAIDSQNLSSSSFSRTGSLIMPACSSISGM